MRYVLVVFALITLSGCKDGEEIVLSKCDAVIKERLVSISSYKRLENTPVFLERYTVAWDRGWKTSGDEEKERENPKLKSLLDLSDALEKHGTKSIAQTIVTYEASNKLGAKVSDKYVCEVATTSKDLKGDETSYSTVRVNGTTAFEWTFQRLSND